MNLTPIAQIGARAVWAVAGLLMVAAAAVGSHGPALVAGMLAAIAVAVGTVFRPAATVAVLLTVAAIVAANPPSVFAALSGLSAAAYLVLRHRDVMPASVTASWPTMVAAIGFTFVGLVAASFPLQLPWLPLAAPLAVLAMYLLAIRPFLD